LLKCKKLLLKIMNYPQLVNNNYECDKYNIHRYVDELQSIKSE